MDASTRLVLFDLVICGCIACFLTAGSSVYCTATVHAAGGAQSLHPIPD